MARLPDSEIGRNSSGDTGSSASADAEASAPRGTQLRTAQVREHVFETFGSVQKAEHWLSRLNQVFQGRTPLQALESDPEAVEAEITRIDHGVYI